MSNGNSSSKNSSDVLEQIEIECQKQSNYLKLQDGEMRTLRFDKKKVEIVDNEFDGNKTRRVESKVIDPNANDGEKILSMALTNARRIKRLMDRGKNVLEIERIGSGRNTIYNISQTSA